MYYLGFDIGGSSVKSVLVKNRKIVKSRVDKLPKDFKGLVDLIVRRTQEFESAGKIAGIGFSFPGPLDLKRERILKAPNIAYLNNKPIKKILQSRLRHLIKIEHDVHCFLLAEKKVGLAKNLKNVFYLTLGSGIGGAFTINGKIIKGSHGAAGEAGHMVMQFRIQNSESRIKESFDLEDLVSNKFVKRMTDKGAEEITRLAESGHKKAREVLKLLGRNLGIGLANITNVFDPEAIILSGGMIGAKKFIEPGIKSSSKQFVISPEARKTKVLFSKVGYYGGALGAALLFEK